MKILQLTVHYTPNIGGVETHLTDLVSELVNRNHDIFVLTYRPLVAKSRWQMLERFQTATILRLPWLPGFFYTFNASPIIEFLYLIPGLFLALPLVLLFFRPRVIHAHGLISGYIGVFWGKVFHTRVVVSTHSLYHFPPQGMYHHLARWIFTHADEVLCLSSQSVKEIEQLGVSSTKVKQFTYWINTEVFSPQKKDLHHTVWKGKFVILFVGRLVPEKGLRELMQASTLLDSSFLVVIVGDGPLADEIETAAKLTGSTISFLRKINNSDLPVYYSSADVVIVPSIHEEGFGRVILEALSCGTPVVAANRGAIPEALDATVGELITITPKDIAESLKKLQGDLKHLELMAKQARKFALEHYSSKNADVIIESYGGSLFT